MRRLRKLSRNLLENSIEAFVLGLETINRPSINYRAEAFAFLFCNAWELLIKAKLHQEHHKIFYPKKRSEPCKSISLDDCLNKVFTAQKDPVKLNILKIHELRNEAIHLAIPVIPPSIMSIFQAGVLNFPTYLNKWFNISLSEKVPLGMMSLVYDFDPAKYSLESSQMKRKLPADTIKRLKDFQQEVDDEAKSLGKQNHQYCIPITLKLAITKNPKKADIVLGASKTGQEAIMLEVPKDPDQTHPHRRTELIKAVNGKLGKDIINGYDITSIKAVHKIENRAEFYYLSKMPGRSPQYSSSFIDWVLKKIEKDSDFGKKTRGEYKQMMRAQKEG